MIDFRVWLFRPAIHLSVPLHAIVISMITSIGMSQINKVQFRTREVRNEKGLEPPNHLGMTCHRNLPPVIASVFAPCCVWGAGWGEMVALLFEFRGLNTHAYPSDVFSLSATHLPRLIFLISLFVNAYIIPSLLFRVVPYIEYIHQFLVASLLGLSFR